MDLAPIVLFVYNRPKHTLETLEALKSNEYSDKSILYIYADGAKETALTDDIKNIQEVRSIIKSKKWCKEIIIIEQQDNFGLAKSIINGVTEIIDKHGKIIVLEDDMVTSKYFLKYMNNSLNYYEIEKRIFHINGFNNQSNLQFVLDDYYMLNFMFCWGWGTWKDRWVKLDKDYKKHYDNLISDENLLRKFNYGTRMNGHEQLAANINKKIKTWAILWNCTIFFNNGLCLTSKKSYVQNIGLDGSGENCGKDNFYDLKISDKIKPFTGNVKILEKKRSRLHLKLFSEYGRNFKLYKFLYRTLKKQFK
ncbi:hypothetical protein [Mariniflexile sp. AS56]|uniref:hypothetical protein n=1 Tax=Mariniflexile sp. AS56 TaxID=3063957 RepID=UPI0026EDC813|nr:hypothetical protein [Mariniflexile sp. AS56]MDO7172734.1 hypothetical protein [Mariniflexile sp. AS56]